MKWWQRKAYSLGRFDGYLAGYAAGAKDGRANERRFQDILEKSRRMKAHKEQKAAKP